MKSFWKTFDKILGLIILTTFVGFVVYVGFINKNALKPTYTVTLNIEGVQLEKDAYSIKSGSTLDLPTPNKEGYNFEGWFLGDTLWTPDMQVSNDTELTARWSPKKYAITFIVDGVKYERQCDYDSIPSFGSTPIKAPTESTEYTFTSWQPEITKVSGNATYTANFNEEPRKFNLSIVSNLENASTLTGSGRYNHGSNATISATPKHGYSFLGWFKNGVQYSTDSSITINNITEDILLEARFTTIKKTISYHNYAGTLLNPTSYDVTNGTFTLLPQNQNGYSFEGWFTEPDGNGIKIEAIDSSELKTYELYAHYSLLTYGITYNLNGGTIDGNNPESYQITDHSFTLINPTKDNHTFIGWTGTDLATYSTSVTVQSGSYGNRIYTANWQPIKVYVSLVVDGIELNDDTIELNCGDNLSIPTINSTKYGMSGYSPTTWFTSNACTTPFDLSEPINTDITIYSKWQYVVDDGFYSNISRFNSARENGYLILVSPDNESTLIDWVEYIAFYDIRSNIKISFDTNYSVSADSMDGLNTKVSALISKSTLAKTTSLSYSYTVINSQYILTGFVCTDDAITNGSLNADPERTGCYQQLDYAFHKTSPGRNNEFNNFNINNVKNTISVTTSNQLVYAYEHGLNPIPVSGSAAEVVLNKAKNILREICDDSMNELEKVRAIYDWLILNVNYDHTAANTISDQDSINYDAWYAEGVFNNNKAVCDGYAKAFIILAKLENIPAVRVTGNKHAWNRVYLNGAWFGIDATHGDLSFNGQYEVLNYKSFLFTDAEKTAKGYTSTDYSYLPATTSFNYYATEVYTKDLSSADLHINSIDEFNKLMSTLSSYSYSSPYFTIEIAIENSFYLTLNESFGSRLNSLIYNSSKTHNFNLRYSAGETIDASGNHVFTLILQ